nr:hypothetical protein [Candidatus Palauibacterales bacterium]
MPESATLVHVTGTSPDLSISSGLPPDLLEQVRKRVRVLALLLLAAFGSDLVIALGIALSSLFSAGSLPPAAIGEGSLLLANVL